MPLLPLSREDGQCGQQVRGPVLDAGRQTQRHPRGGGAVPTKRAATIVYPKQQYVDAVKRDMMSCELCARPVLAGEEHAFIFDHRDPATKMKGKDTLAGETGGVAGLVNNHCKAATLDKIKDVLINEMDLCRLLCANCDHRQTHGYPTRV